MKKLVFLVAFMASVCCIAQKNVQTREIVKRDTIEATNYVDVEEYITKSGSKSFRARWCGKAINISKSVAEDILGGSDAYVVVARYNNGEVIRQKVITLYSK